MPNDLERLRRLVLKFRDDRDWKQFHTPKDVALSLLLEAAELLEHFQWKNGETVAQHVAENKEAIGEEIADVFYWVLLLAHDLDIDLPAALRDKIRKNEKKYPIRRSRGKATKYDRL